MISSLSDIMDNGYFLSEQIDEFLTAPLEKLLETVL